MTRTPRLAAYGTALLLTMAVAAELLGTGPAMLRAPDAALPLPSPTHPVAADEARAGGQVQLSGQAQSWVAIILARPLFSRDRRPADAPAAPNATPENLPRLTGVAVSPAGRHAIFAATAGGKPLVASLGDHVAGYTVQAIEPGAVTILGPNGPRLLQPLFAGQAIPAVAASSRLESNSGPLLDLSPARNRFALPAQP